MEAATFTVYGRSVTFTVGQRVKIDSAGRGFSRDNRPAVVTGFTATKVRVRVAGVTGTYLETVAPRRVAALTEAELAREAWLDTMPRTTMFAMYGDRGSGYEVGLRRDIAADVDSLTAAHCELAALIAWVQRKP